MGGQLSLFDNSNLARRTDPQTSHEAAEVIEEHLGKIQLLVRKVFADSPRALTSQEAARACVMRHGGMVESYRKRVRELVRLGVLRETGTRDCRVTGRNVTTFKIIRNK